MRGGGGAGQVLGATMRRTSLVLPEHEVASAHETREFQWRLAFPHPTQAQKTRPTSPARPLTRMRARVGCAASASQL